MTDLVKQLRARYGQWTLGIAVKAADEIEQLRLQLALAKTALEEIYTQDTRVTDGGKCHDLGPCAEIATAALCVLADDDESSEDGYETLGQSMASEYEH